MSTPDEERSTVARDDAAAQAGTSASELGAARDDEAAAQDVAEAPGEGATGSEDGPVAAQRGDGPTPLASLSSLLGGSLEGGVSCAADGTCD